MTSDQWVGCRVEIVARGHLDFMTDYPRRAQHAGRLEGIVTHVAGFGEGHDGGDVWARIDGLTREYVFGPYQLEVLPPVGGGAS